MNVPVFAWDGGMRRSYSGWSRAACLALLVVAAVAGPASAAVDFDCDDFRYREDAQAVLDHDPTDRHNLDPNDDGWACTSLPSRRGDAPATASPDPVAEVARPVPEQPVRTPVAAAAPEPAPSMPEPDRSVSAPDGERSDGQGRRDATLEGTIRQSVGEVNRYWRWAAGEAGWRYDVPGVESFSGRIRTGCGAVPAGVGPFYCVLDETVYLDTELLDIVFVNVGDGGVRYAVAHEYAHHVQSMHGLRSAAVPMTPGTVFNVQMELHADCWAGAFLLWESTRERIDDHDAASALITAYAIGDVAGTSLLDPAAHGSPEMRMEAMSLGYETGDLDACTAAYIALES